MTAAAYQPIRRLAVGGMAEIFLARQRGAGGFDRLVVIKRLLPQLVESGDVANMFFDEARIVANLVHPNIVQIYELGTEDGQPFLTLEYVSGANVAQIFERDRKALRRELAVHIVAETARALDFAHRAVDADGKPLGIVHRDVSPQNVMVSRAGDIKLMDFGIAKARSRLQRTDTGMIKGKVAYMAPEQIRGEDVDPRTDVFAAGVLLWELTVGQRLFAGQNDAHTITRVLGGAAPPPRSVDPDYPADLEAIAMAALAPDRDARTRTAGELDASLRDWLGRAGAVDKAELAALVERLFPQREISEPIQLIATREVDAVTATATAMPELVTQADRPANKRAPTSPPPAAAPANRRRGLLLAIVAVAALAAGAWVVVHGFGGSDTASRSGETATGSSTSSAPAVARDDVRSGSGASTTAGRTGDDGLDSGGDAIGSAGGLRAATRVDRSSTNATPPAGSSTRGTTRDGRASTNVTPRPSSSTSDATTRDGRPTKAMPPAGSPATRDDRPTGSASTLDDRGAGSGVPDHARADDARPTAPAGTLVVAADGEVDKWTKVAIDGKDHGPTPFQGELAPGTYAIAVTIQGKPFTATAKIEPTKKTKCRATGGALVCDSPQ